MHVTRPGDLVSAARLILAEKVLASFAGGFAAPLPLVLFAHDQVADAPLTATRDEALDRLDEMGASSLRVSAVTWLLRELAALGAPLFRRREMAFTDAGPEWLLACEPKRTATGFAARPVHIDDAWLREALSVSEATLQRGLQLLHWRACLDVVPRTAVLAYELGSIVPADTTESAFVASLAEACPARETLRSDLNRSVARLVTLLGEATPLRAAVWRRRTHLPTSLRNEPWRWPEALGASEESVAPFAPEPVPGELPAADDELLERIRWAPDATDLEALFGATPTSEQLDAEWPQSLLGAVVMADPEVGPQSLVWHEAWGLFVAGLASHPQQALQLWKPLVWRAPHAAFELLATSEPPPRAVAEVIAEIGAEALRAPHRGSRPEQAAQLGSELFDAGHIYSGLGLLRAAADRDAPERSTLSILRRTLKSSYGLPFDSEGPFSQAPFIFSEEGAKARDDDVRDLGRILYDGVVGAVYEPNLAGDEEREILFSTRVGPALAYLDADPTERGGRVRLRRPRPSQRGPGLGIVLAFLVGLAALIVLVGWLLRALV